MRVPSFAFYLATAGLLAGLSGCDRGQNNDEPRNVDAPARADDSEPARADNTERNERDRGNTLTPGDQSETEADRNITQSVRQAVVGKDGLSMNAKNVKIITNDGVVTLRGPVASAAEKADIAALAQQTQGVTRVDNQLEIASE